MLAVLVPGGMFEQSPLSALFSRSWKGSLCVAPWDDWPLGGFVEISSSLCLSRAPWSHVCSVAIGFSPLSLVGFVHVGSSQYFSFPPLLVWGEGLDFQVKGGLVIELFVRVRLKNGLGSFVGSSTLIFSPSPLGIS